MGDKSDSLAVVDEQIESLLEDIATEEEICDYTITGSVGSEKGEGYSGIMTTVEITGKNKENESTVLNLIVKSASKSDALRAQLALDVIFEREIYMYATVFPTFREFEKRKDLPESSFAPRFYKSNLTHKNEALILENLKSSGYRLYERRKPMDENHVKVVLSKYGRMHALSLALRDQNPEKFKSNVASMNDHCVTLLKETGFKTMVVQMCVKAQEALDPRTDEEVIKIYEAFVYSIDRFVDVLSEPDDNYYVALHGDCWTNNMLFKYKDKSDASSPTEVLFIDFQGSRLGSPVLDLAYFIYSCGSKEMINHLDHYMQLYYNSLSEYLQTLGSSPDKVFPYSVLQEHWKKYAKYGLMFSILIIHVMLTEKNETTDFSENAETGKNLEDAFSYKIANAEKYSDRVGHIIKHFVANNFI